MADEANPLTLEMLNTMIEKMISPEQRQESDEEDDAYDQAYVGHIDLDDPDFDYVKVTYAPDNPDPFSIGQSYEDATAQQIKCRQCGGVNFHVAMGSYYTAIRCVTCRWEACAHDG